MPACASPPAVFVGMHKTPERSRHSQTMWNFQVDRIFMLYCPSSLKVHFRACVLVDNLSLVNLSEAFCREQESELCILLESCAIYSGNTLFYYLSYSILASPIPFLPLLLLSFLSHSILLSNILFLALLLYSSLLHCIVLSYSILDSPTLFISLLLYSCLSCLILASLTFYS